ncbi:unnamed protein product [Cyprideis torosa]|uniref:Uncharacterized protein n=1 Tax=Cyprideis torosa TaxID=163714 RepID=A0A7R8WBU8_9CRUS|nr:unnamed protein product [Cyprideis torosa]CAG0887757.1 unnamed protein product [Cyprideis torosa]
MGSGEDSAVEDVQEKIIRLLNEAASNEGQRTSCLHKVHELVLHRAPSLLKEFLGDILYYQADREPSLRKILPPFIEKVLKHDGSLLPLVVGTLQFAIQDSNPNVVKSLLSSMVSIYRTMLEYVSQHPVPEGVGMEEAWEKLSRLKDDVCELMDSENDGIRTLAIKFMETLVLIQSYPDASIPRDPKDTFSLEKVPLNVKLARPRLLEEESRAVFQDLVKFHNSPHISSINLMAAMGALVNIGKLRPTFLGQVLDSLSRLHANLPPTLSRSQVASVKKMLRVYLLQLLKLRYLSSDQWSQIYVFLTDLGTTPGEMERSLPSDLVSTFRRRREEHKRALAKAEQEKEYGNADSRPPPGEEQPPFSPGGQSP